MSDYGTTRTMRPAADPERTSVSQTVRDAEPPHEHEAGHALIHHRKEEEKVHDRPGRGLAGRIREIAKDGAKGRHRGGGFHVVLPERRDTSRSRDRGLGPDGRDHFVQDVVEFAVLRGVAVVRKEPDVHGLVAAKDGLFEPVREVDHALNGVAPGEFTRIRGRVADFAHAHVGRGVELFDEGRGVAARVEVDHGDGRLKDDVVRKEDRKDEGHDRRDEDRELVVRDEAPRKHRGPFVKEALPQALTHFSPRPSSR